VLPASSPTPCKGFTGNGESSHITPISMPTFVFEDSAMDGWSFLCPGSRRAGLVRNKVWVRCWHRLCNEIRSSARPIVVWIHLERTGPGACQNLVSSDIDTRI